MVKKKRVLKKRLVGFTKVNAKYKLVFKKGSKNILGATGYKTKSALVKAAKKYVK